jgi:hypothetical protein
MAFYKVFPPGYGVDQNLYQFLANQYAAMQIYAKSLQSTLKSVKIQNVDPGNLDASGESAYQQTIDYCRKEIANRMQAIDGALDANARGQEAFKGIFAGIPQTSSPHPMAVDTL